MSMDFAIIDTDKMILWDFGWFDTSCFSVCPVKQHPDAVLAAFVRSQMFQRSFCSKPNSWGYKHEVHGPFLTRLFQVNWYNELPMKDLKSAVRQQVLSYDFKPNVSAHQLEQIDSWSTRQSKCTAWHLCAPGDDAAIRVEFESIWWAFDEFVFYDSETSQLSVAVIGFD